MNRFSLILLEEKISVKFLHPNEKVIICIIEDDL